jgi:hypothetical protein
LLVHIATSIPPPLSLSNRLFLSLEFPFPNLKSSPHQRSNLAFISTSGGESPEKNFGANMMMAEDLGVEAKEASVREVAKLLPLPELLQSISSIKADYISRQQVSDLFHSLSFLFFNHHCCFLCVLEFVI